MPTDLPRNAAELFDDAGLLENAVVTSAKIHNKGSGGQYLMMSFSDDAYGQFALTIHPDTRYGNSGVYARLVVDYDEPPGAGADPYGRPDPMTNPEAWTE